MRGSAAPPIGLRESSSNARLACQISFFDEDRSELGATEGRNAPLCTDQLAIARVRSHRGILGAALGALLCAGQPAQALTIIPSFDTSWAAAPAGATMDVYNVIAEYEADFSNPVTITIAFGWGEVEGQPLASGAMTNFSQAN